LTQIVWLTETVIVDFTRVTRGLKLAHGARAEAHAWCDTEDWASRFAQTAQSWFGEKNCAF